MPSWKKVVVSGSDAAIPSVSTAADFTIDAGGDIILDADGTDILLKDGGTEFGSFKRASSDFIIKSATNDKDIVFKGVDDSSTITALTLDMSEGGNAILGGNISGSMVSTGSFGRAEGTSFSYVFDSNGSLVYDGDELVYRNSGNEKFKVDNSQMTTETGNFTNLIKIGGENKIQLDESSVSLVIKQNDGGMVDNLTMTKEGELTLHRGGATITTGNISGSTTSTGSFGKVETDGDATFNGNVSINGTNATIANATNPHLFLNDTNAGAAIFQQSGNDTRIGSDSNTQVLLVQNNATAVTIDTNKDAFFVGNISGSVIRASGDIIAFNSSDERLKDNVTYIHKPIEKINQIGGYEFDWNEKQQVYSGHDVGVLAQEIEKVIPEAVKNRGSGYKGVQYDKIIPLLIEGIKELTKKTKKLEKEIKKLKHKK